MKKIYVVTSGDYSDYKIDAVFDDKKLAKKFIDSFENNQYSGMEIEEWELNPLEKEIKSGYHPYFVRMNMNFEAVAVDKEDSSYGFTRPSFGNERDVQGNFITSCYAKDEEHAVKIASERLAIYKANHPITQTETK